MSGAESAINHAKCTKSDSILTVIDLQQRLGGAMPAKVLNRVIFNATLLSQAAGLLDIPVLKTEQYPRGLGPTLPNVIEALPESTTAFEKTAFSCCGADGFLATVDQLQRRQLILVGMEAHVCIMQTAIDLTNAGLEVFVVEDAVCSRRLENYQNALDRLRQSAISVVTAESVVFEWIEDADHAHFKAIQKLLR